MFIGTHKVTCLFGKIRVLSALLDIVRTIFVVLPWLSSGVVKTAFYESIEKIFWVIEVFLQIVQFFSFFRTLSEELSAFCYEIFGRLSNLLSSCPLEQKKETTFLEKEISTICNNQRLFLAFSHFFFVEVFKCILLVYENNLLWVNRFLETKFLFFPTVSDLELSALRYKVSDRSDKTFFEVSIRRIWAQFFCAVFELWENFTWPSVDFFHRVSHNYILRVQSIFLTENIYLLKKCVCSVILEHWAKNLCPLLKSFSAVLSKFYFIAGVCFSSKI